VAAAQPAGLPRGVEAFARAAQRVEDFSHAIVASHRPPGGDPAFHRATISHQPYYHVQNQLLDSSPLLLAPDDELGVPPPEKLLLESSDEPDELLGEPEDDELLDRPDELGALLLDELLGGGGGGAGGDKPLDEEPESLDEDAPGLLDDPLEPEALVPELLDEDGRPPEELLSGLDDDELLWPLLETPLALEELLLAGGPEEPDEPLELAWPDESLDDEPDDWPELLGAGGPEELLSGPDDDELLWPLLLEPLLELEERPKALDAGPLLDGTPLDDELDELPLAELLDELPEELLDEGPLLEEPPEEDELSPLDDELPDGPLELDDGPLLLDEPLEDELLELGEPPLEELDEPLDDEEELLDELLELDEPLREELPDEEDDRPDELPLEELLPGDEPDEDPDELPEEELDEPLLDDDPEELLDEDELELPLDELLEDGGQTL
jgi:hypothetical protein